MVAGKDYCLCVLQLPKLISIFNKSLYCVRVFIIIIIIIIEYEYIP